MLFSIIIPTYNRANLLMGTINSIQNQTFKSWELIIVDDGSTDQTADLVSQLILLDARIRYIYQKNAERSVARNNGIKHAKGKYICFLDSDDQYEENHLEKLYHTIQLEGVPKAMFFTLKKILEGEKVCFEQLPKLAHNVQAYLLRNPISPSQVCIHSEILETFLFDENIVIVEDIILWLKISSEFPIYRLEQYTIKYLVHENNSVNYKHQNSPLKMYQGLNIFYKKYPAIAASIPFAMRKTVESEILFNIAKHHLLNNRRHKGAFWVLQSITRDIQHVHTRFRINVFLKSFFGLNYSRLIA